jgi:hypothetical protein
MADAQIHIHINNPVDLGQIDKLLTAAVEAKQVEMQTKVPTGYRCAECFRGDGGHEATCNMRMQEMNK